MFNGCLRHIRSRHLCEHSSLYPGTHKLRQQWHTWADKAQVAQEPSQMLAGHELTKNYKIVIYSHGCFLLPWSLSVNHSTASRAALSKILHILLTSPHFTCSAHLTLDKVLDVHFERPSASSLSPHLLPHPRHHVFQSDCSGGNPAPDSAPSPALHKSFS